MFVIDRAVPGPVVTYKIKEWDRTPVRGVLYEQDVQKVDVPDDALFRVEKVLATTSDDQLTGKVVTNDTVLFLSCVYIWQFVHLNDAFDAVTRTSVHEAPSTFHPVHLCCNVVGNQITDLLRDVPYKDKPLWWEPQHVHYRKVLGDVVEIVEVEVGERDGSLVTLDEKGETQVVLHFKRGP